MQGSRIRKWLTYIALVVTAGVLAGVIAAIAGAIFTHYVRDAERDEDAPSATLLDRALGVGMTAVAITASVTGVLLIDPPAVLRARERDEARLQAIADIASAVDCYATYEGGAPESLEAMRAALDARAASTTIRYACSWSVQTDPATDAPYEYRRLGEDAYEVCATFDRRSDEPDGARRPRTYSFGAVGEGPREFNAIHEAGRHCFSLTAESLETPDTER
jgi:hypothetical protein